MNTILAIAIMTILCEAKTNPEQPAQGLKNNPIRMLEIKKIYQEVMQLERSEGVDTCKVGAQTNKVLRKIWKKCRLNKKESNFSKRYKIYYGKFNGIAHYFSRLKLLLLKLVVQNIVFIR